jgi:RNA polymerase sigma-70 factor (ECF subfamily)
MNDGDIIARVRAGDTGAFAELVRRHQDRVFGMALRTTGKPEDAEDLAQDVFLAVFRGLAGFKGDAQFTTWLYRVAWNRCADWLRRNRKPGRRTVPLEDAGDVADGRADPASRTVDRDERRRLRAAMDGLDELYRSVIELAGVQGMSYADVGAALGVPVKTVETRLYRARRQLRERLAAE